MFEHLILFLQTHILPWGPLGVFLASVIEEVVAPIPSALIMTMSGFLFVTGSVSVSSISTLIFKVALPAAFGVTLGSLVIYGIARKWGKVVIDQFGKYIGLYYSDIEKLQSKLTGTKKDEVIIGVARIIPFVPSVAISAFCGLIGMSFYKYLVISFVGTFIRGIILGAVGWQVGAVYIKYAEAISHFESYVLYTIVVAVIVFLVIKWKGES